jgi:hypothetical protein
MDLLEFSLHREQLSLGDHRSNHHIVFLAFDAAFKNVDLMFRGGITDPHPDQEAIEFRLW